MSFPFASAVGEIRHTVRSLCRNKAFTATVLATFTLCLGANLAIFTIVYSILFAPLPFAGQDRLVVCDNSYSKVGLEHVGASVANYHEWGEGIPAFAETGAYETIDALIGGSGAPERVKMAYATPSFFRVLGAQAQLGRLFLEEEGSYGGSNHWNVAVISDAFWRQHYAADPAIIGKPIVTEGIEHIIVGVLPPGFRYLSTEPAVWITLIWTADQAVPQLRHRNTTNIVARLRPDVSLAQAQVQIDALNRHLTKGDPNATWAEASGFRTTVRSAREAHVAPVRSALLLLQGGALLLLVIGGVNIANLLVIRTSTRGKELAIRQALGAGRGTIFGQLLCEALLLTGGGTALGFGFAAAALQLIDKLGVDQLPLGATVHLYWTVIGAAAVAAIGLALVLALPSLVLAFRPDLGQALAAESRSGTTSRSTHRFRQALIVAQIALAFVLLTGTAVFTVSLKHILAVKSGVRAENVLTASVGVPWKTYQEGPSRSAFIRRWLARLRSIPGVQTAALATSLPVSDETGVALIFPEGHPPAPGESAPGDNIALVIGDYFTSLGIPLREGRYLEDADYEAGRKVCVIDENLARRYWPGQSPVGHHLYINIPYLIVGVVEPVKQNGLARKETRGMVYVPMEQERGPFRTALIVRSPIPVAVLVPELRQALLDIDPMLPLDNVKPLQVRIDETIVFQRTLMVLAVFFGVSALSLAGIGVYGVLAYSVVQRQREVGVRLALGALPAQIMGQFLTIGCNMLLLGTALGIFASYATGRLIEALLFEVSPSNPAILFCVAATLGAVVFLASLLPSRRAAAVSVMEALRHD